MSELLMGDDLGVVICELARAAVVIGVCVRRDQVCDRRLADRSELLLEVARIRTFPSRVTTICALAVPRVCHTISWTCTAWSRSRPKPSRLRVSRSIGPVV
jgi:hypothetical protein